jgi:hypothetical protein
MSLIHGRYSLKWREFQSDLGHVLMPKLNAVHVAVSPRSMCHDQIPLDLSVSFLTGLQASSSTTITKCFLHSKNLWLGTKYSNKFTFTDDSCHDQPQVSIL